MLVMVGVLVWLLAPSPPADLPLRVQLDLFEGAVPPRHSAQPPPEPEPAGLA